MFDSKTLGAQKINAISSCERCTKNQQSRYNKSWTVAACCGGIFLICMSSFVFTEFRAIRFEVANLRAENAELRAVANGLNNRLEVLENAILTRRKPEYEEDGVENKASNQLVEDDYDNDVKIEVRDSDLTEDALPALKGDLGLAYQPPPPLEPDDDDDRLHRSVRRRRQADDGGSSNERVRHCRRRCKGDKGDPGRSVSVRPSVHVVADEEAEPFDSHEIELLDQGIDIQHRNGLFHPDRGYLVPEDGILNIWHMTENSSSFQLQDFTKVVVREAGYYHIYSQIMYNNPSSRNSHVIKISDADGSNERSFITCMSLAPNTTTNTPTSRYISCYTGGVTYIRRDSKVWVQTLYGRRRIRLLPHLTFFGMYKVS